MAISQSYIRPATHFSRAALSLLGGINILFVAVVLYRVLTPDPIETFEGMRPGRIGVLTQTIIGLLFSLLGVFILRLARHRSGVIMLSGFLLSQGLAIGFLMVLGMIGASHMQFHISRFLINWMAYLFAIRTVQLFPRRINRQSLLESRPLGRLTVVVDSLRGPLRAGLFAAGTLIVAYLARSELLFHFGQSAVIVVVVLTMTASYRLGGARVRKKIYWLLLGALILLLSRLLLVSSHILLNLFGIEILGIRSIVWSVANLGLLGCVAFAVFYRGVVDPRAVVRKTAAYSLSIVALLFALAAFENFVSGIVTRHMGIDRGAVAALSGAAIAVLVKPFVDFLSQVAERVLPKI